jgi:hypothetical protein
MENKIKKQPPIYLQNNWRDLHHKLLYAFLKRKCVLDKYAHNCRMNKYTIIRDANFDTLVKEHGIMKALNVYPFNHINCAFNWSETKEGSDFWFNLYVEFVKFLGKRKKQFFEEYEERFGK